MRSSSRSKNLHLTVKQAIALHRNGQLDDAERRYRIVLRQEPDHPDALHFLGLLLHQRGDIATGTDMVRRATVAAPGYADAFNNLGNLLKLAGNLEEAETAYRRAAALGPGDANAHSNLGVVLRARGHLSAAEVELRAALAIDGRHVAALTNLGHLLKRTARLQEAIACYRAAIALDPDNPMAPHVLGLAYQANGDIEKAREVFQAWFDRDPGNPVAAHMLSACAGTAVPPRASDGYVRALFDEIADSFDEHLSHLGYRAPLLVGAALASARPVPRGDLDVLDAGCGTGLCGTFLRPQARTLVGVDLSGGMLRRAQALTLYDQLIEGELTAFLAARPRAYDIIVSADTLCYFGSLETVFAAAAAALRPCGLLFFTVEDARDEATAGYHLQPHGRYSHMAWYVRQTLEAAGLPLEACEAAVLRTEAGAPVGGLVVTARRPARE